MTLNDDPVWEMVGIAVSDFETKAEWLCEKRNLHGKSLRFFEVAGSLVRFSRYDYKLASVAFFQATMGLEKALKLHYAKKTGFLGPLLVKAHSDGLIGDEMFGDAPKFTDWFARSVRERIGKARSSRAVTLVALLPKLRNEYAHGDYILAPDLLHLTSQVRMIADVLTTKRPRFK